MEIEALRQDIEKRVGEVRKMPNKSPYSQGLKDGWVDALNWVLKKVD